MNAKKAKQARREAGQKGKPQRSIEWGVAVTTDLVIRTLTDECGATLGDLELIEDAELNLFESLSGHPISFGFFIHKDYLDRAKLYAKKITETEHSHLHSEDGLLVHTALSVLHFGEQIAITFTVMVRNDGRLSEQFVSQLAAA